MLSTPKSSRLHISVFGKRNAGKSSLINKLTGQTVSIVSEIAGTTTDPVEKAMEVLPLGPVVFIDTAGIDDESDLGAQRVNKTLQVIDRTDIAIIVCDYNGWDNFEQELYTLLKQKNIPALAVINKADENRISDEDLKKIENLLSNPIITSVKNDENTMILVKQQLINLLPEDFLNQPAIASDLLKEGDLAVLVVAVDSETPKGRLILPQVQVIRDLLDYNHPSLVLKVTELKNALDNLKRPPALVITDSQIFKEVCAILPENILMTSFSVLFARLKGDLNEFVKSVKFIDRLEDNDKVLFCESCTHHQTEDDIARVKIPNLIKRKTGKNVIFEYHRGHGFVENIKDYKLIIHCGACMTNRREILSRIMAANANNVALTNYGLAIAHCLGILDRALQPFQDDDSLNLNS